MAAIDRIACERCKILLTRSRCPRASERPNPSQLIPVAIEPTSVESVLDEMKLYPICLHHVPRGCNGLLASFTAEFLKKAASSRSLADLRALFLAPRVILAPLNRDGVKHDRQVFATIKDRIALWPTASPPEPVTSKKHRKKRSNLSQQPIARIPPISAGREQLFEQAVREQALSKACHLMDSDESKPDMDVEKEMKPLDNGRLCQVLWIFQYHQLMKLSTPSRQSSVVVHLVHLFNCARWFLFVSLFPKKCSKFLLLLTLFKFIF